MPDFTTRKIVSDFPITGVPNCLYLRKVDNNNFEMRMANKSDGKLLKFSCGERLMVYSSLLVTGPTAAKYDTNVDLELHVLNEGITSYDVSINRGPTTNITGNIFTVPMSSTVGDVMTIVFIPRDDIGTNYYPVVYSILVTAGDPIDSGLIVTGPTSCEVGKSITLTLDSYDNDIGEIEYRLGPSSWISVDTSDNNAKNITVTPIGAVGQTVPIEFRPKTKTQIEYLSVYHNVLLIEIEPDDSGANIVGDNLAPQNVPYSLNITCDNNDIKGYTVNTNTTPAYEWDFNTKDPSWLFDVTAIPVGTEITITAHPFGDAVPNQPYQDVTHTFTIADPVVSNSNVTLTGPAIANSNSSYTLLINNTNSDIKSFKIIWNGEDKGIITDYPDKYIHTKITEVLGDTVHITVIPLSKTNKLYTPLTKDIDILARLPENSGINIIADDKYPAHGSYVENILTANMEEKVNNVNIKYNGIDLGNRPATTHEWTKAITLPKDTIVEVIHTPISNDPNYKYLPITTSFLVDGPIPIVADIDIDYSETVTPGGTNTITWVLPDDANAAKVYIDGVYKATIQGKNGTYTTPSSSTTPNYVHTVKIVPLSSTDLVYAPVIEDYVVTNPPEPVDSGLVWRTPPEVEEGSVIHFIREGTCDDLDNVKVYVDGQYHITLDSGTINWNYTPTGFVAGDIVDFEFRPKSLLPDRPYNIEDETVLVVANNSLSATTLNKTGIDNTTPFGTVYWDFSLTGYDIDKVDITGNQINNLSNVSPTNVPITITSNIPLGTTIQVCVMARATTGEELATPRCYPLLVNSFSFNTPEILLPEEDTNGGIPEIHQGEIFTWETPNVTPENMDNIKLVVYASTLPTIPGGSERRYFYFNIVNHQPIVKALPTEVGELHLNQLFPDDGIIYFKARYRVVLDGHTYFSPYSTIRAFKIVPETQDFECLTTNSEYDQINRIHATLSYPTLHVDFNVLFDGCQVVFQIAGRYGFGYTGKFERSSNSGPFESMYPTPIPVGAGSIDPNNYTALKSAIGRSVPLLDDHYLLFSSGQSDIGIVTITNTLGNAGFSNNKWLDVSATKPDNIGSNCRSNLCKIGPNDNEWLNMYEWSSGDDTETTWIAQVEKLSSDKGKAEVVGTIPLQHVAKPGPKYHDVDPVKGYVVLVEQRNDDGTVPSGTPQWDWWDDTGVFHFYKREGNSWNKHVSLTIPKTIQTGTAGFIKDGMFVHIDENSFMRVYDLDAWDFDNGVANAPVFTLQITNQSLVYINQNHLSGNQRTTGGIITMDVNHSDIFTYTEPQATGKYFIFKLDRVNRTVVSLTDVTKPSITNNSKVNALAVIPSGVKHECVLIDSNWDGCQLFDDNSNFASNVDSRVSHFY